MYIKIRNLIYMKVGDGPFIYVLPLLNRHDVQTFSNLGCIWQTESKHQAHKTCIIPNWMLLIRIHNGQSQRIWTFLRSSEIRCIESSLSSYARNRHTCCCQDTVLIADVRGVPDWPSLNNSLGNFCTSNSCHKTIT